MKAVYFRSDEGCNYLIPEDKVEDFDSLIEKIEEMQYNDNFNDDYYDTLDIFNTMFNHHIVEGELSNIKFYMEDE